MNCKIVLTAVILLPVLSACADRPVLPTTSADTARVMSGLAATPEQARLWQEAAGMPATGLEKMPPIERPVQQRARVTTPDRAVKTQSVALAKDLQAGVRIINAPELKEGRFAGAVQVRHVDGERLALDLGEQRTLTLLARVRGKALQARDGQKAELDYRFRDDPFDRQQIFALKLDNGDGIISLLESGRKPVTVQLPLFELSASQVGEPTNNSMAVDVRVGKSHQTLTQGQIAEFPQERVSVGLVASVAHVGADAHRAEGNPYAVHLVAWPVEPQQVDKVR